MPDKPFTLTGRDYEILRDLTPTCSDEPVVWQTPLDIGASNGSDHSYRLTKLAKHGLAEFKQRGAPDEEIGKPARHRSRGSKVYRVTPAGAAELERHTGQPRPTKAEWDARTKALAEQVRARKAARA